ncbi:spore germination protein [Paenibacillus sp. LHD-117]|uniref:spore germination protein n=1 Tax=Paenibacillus sp. LHD-117 TaxID=3071412 RepID=UPI0027E1B723|nr:spore germination protein [Paenibacillus sp. LHD-117]MDQ6421690.1 spore germination protein [Paenibacillus sp. LHD-117]
MPNRDSADTHPNGPGRPNNKPKTLRELLELASRSFDFHQFHPLEPDERVRLSYYSTRIIPEIVTRDLLPVLQSMAEAGQLAAYDELRARLPFAQIVMSEDVSRIETMLEDGFVLLQLQGDTEGGMLIQAHAASLGHRQHNDTENEFSVVGPKVGFVENLDVNVNLLRKMISIPELVFEELRIGSLSGTRVCFAYLDGITNPELINTVRQRLSDVDYEIVFDASLLDQLISDNSNSPFPLFLTTERVDRVAYAVSSGQVAIFSNGSPYALTGPSTFLDFFISPEDYYLPWLLGSFFRLIRLFSVAFSIFASPLYVAILTFHYEVLPDSILGPLILSRINVPFPPVLEVIFLEVTIELLREAGARLPSKIGQTLGIVGGIVIGQASVQAALSSNVLLIIVALAALASFTTPIFKMANTIRFLRFPFILLAAFLGGFGIVIGCFFLLGHMLRLKSFGSPYLVPIFPFRRGNWSDSVIRASFQFTSKRPFFLRPLSTVRFNPATPRKEPPDEEE